MVKVMVVEDDMTLLENMSFELEMRGYDVMTASDGRSALDTLNAEAQPPDIIISDIAMPDMDGFQLLEQVRANPAWNNVPVLFVTAFSSANSMRIGKELGVDDYIVKPFQMDDLVTAMENKLRRVRDVRDQTRQEFTESQQQLLHLLSHEFKSPLTPIYTGAEFLSKNVASLTPETSSRLIGLIRTGAHRMNRLVNNTVLLMQFDSGTAEQKMQSDSKTHEISGLISKACQQVQDAMQKDVEVLITITDSPLYVQGIGEYLKMIVIELVHNALTFSAEGESVNVHVSSDGKHVKLVVEDNGPGIAQENMSAAWDRFTQFDRDKHKQEGAGLGLTLVREGVKLHGGSYRMECPDEGGTRVTVTLPRVNEDGSAL